MGEKYEQVSNVIVIGQRLPSELQELLEKFERADLVHRILSSASGSLDETSDFLKLLLRHQEQIPQKMFTHALDVLVNRIDQGEAITFTIVQFVMKCKLEEFHLELDRSLDRLHKQAQHLVNHPHASPEDEKTYQRWFSEFIDSYGWIPDDDKRFQAVLDYLSAMEERYKNADECLEDLKNSALYIMNDDRSEIALRDELNQEFEAYIEQHGWRHHDDPRMKEVIRILQHLYKHAAMLEKEQAVKLIGPELEKLQAMARDRQWDELRGHYASKHEFFDEMADALMCRYMERIFPSNRIGGVYVSDPAPEHYQLKEILERANIDRSLELVS